MRRPQRHVFGVNDRRAQGLRRGFDRPTGGMAGLKAAPGQYATHRRPNARAAVSRNGRLPWERRDHAAIRLPSRPMTKPRYAVAVLLETRGGGSTAAAPLAPHVMLQAIYGGDTLDALPHRRPGRIAEHKKALRRSSPSGFSGKPSMSYS